MILGIYLRTDLGLGLKFSYCIIVGQKGPYDWCLSPMVDVRNYAYEPPRGKIVKPE